jgi:hypothetical protein
MFGLQLPQWLRILLWVLKVLAEAKPPENGTLKEDSGG